ncbi:MAG: GNAT family N-acetyltransferase [Muribaculum sp.]|nr:GNAT family N-acetyltransferase [Muribaculum sp.]
MISQTIIYAETARLILRSWKYEDLSLFSEMNEDARVMKYFPELLTADETEAFYNRIQEEFDRKSWGLYAVELKSTGRFIGYVGLHEIGFEADFTPGIEIGWRLAADYHNQGYATEAAKEILRLAKSFGIGRLFSFTAEINKPSERVMQKIGMGKVGEFNHPKLLAASPLRPHVLYCIDI